MKSSLRFSSSCDLAFVSSRERASCEAWRSERLARSCARSASKRAASAARAASMPAIWSWMTLNLSSCEAAPARPLPRLCENYACKEQEQRTSKWPKMRLKHYMRIVFRNKSHFEARKGRDEEVVEHKYEHGVVLI